MSDKLKPGTELYFTLIRAQSLITEIGLEGEQGLKKSIRSLDAFISKHSDNAESLNSNAHAIAVHNWNVIHNNIDLDILATPIGELTIEK
jgi:hypothetical protein